MSCESRPDELQDDTNNAASKIIEKNDSVINQMLSTFNQIQENLNEIKRREGLIEIQSIDSADIVEREFTINEDIEKISQLMHQNERLIEQLKNELSSSNTKIDQFRKLVDNLQSRLEEKNREIARLNDALAKKNLKIDKLYFSVDSLRDLTLNKERTIRKQIDDMNVAFYAYGTFKELKDQKVLTKEGGVLGIGAKQELKDDFNETYFSRIDKRVQKSFLIYSKKAELATTHPKESYLFMGSDDQIDSLVIIDPEEFWRTSGYLVIVID
tara:strand:- start:1360 stop:2169 length:810 start_codon:yes stop_codon:yes gene_type:complete